MCLNSFTAVCSPVAGHVDHLRRKGELAQANFENKMVLPIGPFDPSFGNLTDLAEVTSSMSPGFLGFPAFKVASVCRGMCDMESHSLGETLHLYSRMLPHRNKKGEVLHWRGGWNCDRRLHPQALGVCDWRDAAARNPRSQYYGGWCAANSLTL